MAKSNTAERNRRAAEKIKKRIADQLKRGAGKGVEAAVRFLSARIKEAVSVPAPKKAIRGVALPGKKLGPIVGYRATTPAVKGAPPRVVSNKLRSGVTHKMLTPQIGLVGVHARAEPSKKYPEGFNYPEHLETSGDGLGDGEHPFVGPTVDKFRKELRTIVGIEVRMELRR